MADSKLRGFLRRFWHGPSIGPGWLWLAAFVVVFIVGVRTSLGHHWWGYLVLIVLYLAIYFIAWLIWERSSSE
jgi:hypothetical protein